MRAGAVVHQGPRAAPRPLCAPGPSGHDVVPPDARAATQRAGRRRAVGSEGGARARAEGGVPGSRRRGAGTGARRPSPAAVSRRPRPGPCPGGMTELPAPGTPRRPLPALRPARRRAGSGAGRRRGTARKRTKRLCRAPNGTTASARGSQFPFCPRPAPAPGGPGGRTREPPGALPALPRRSGGATAFRTLMGGGRSPGCR